MLFSTLLSNLLLIGIPTLTAAVDIKAFVKEGCPGAPYKACTNIPMNVCCAVFRDHRTAGASSAEFLGLPPNSRILGWQTTRDGRICGAVVSDHTVSGNVCLSLSHNIGEYAGLSWTKATSKRQALVQDVRCTKSQDVDTIGLADGTEYTLVGMSSGEQARLWELASAGADREEIQAQLTNITAFQQA